MGFVTANRVPDGANLADPPQPMPPEVANHVAAVTLFGTPSTQFMSIINEPPVAIGPLYQPKTIKVCAPEDPVCSDGMNFAAHDTYASDGAMIDKGAAFAASRLGEGPAAPAGAGPASPTTVVASPGAPGGGFGS